MKKIKIISLLAALLLSATGYAQLKVKSNGKAIVGSESTSWVGSVAAGLSIYGTGTYEETDARVSFGKFIKNGNQYSGVFVGCTPQSYATKSLHLHGDHSIVMTAGSLSDDFNLNNTTNIIMNYHPTPNKLFIRKATQFYSSVAVQGTFTNSDARLKTDIKKIESPTARLMKLEGLSYLKKNPYAPVDDAEGGAKEETTPEMGFLAQEVEKVFPDLVVTDHEGYKSINYIALIPVIVEVVKEQQSEIENQKSLIAAQSKKIAELAGDAGANVLLPGSSQARLLAVQGQNETIAADVAANAFLYQNEPNPFSQSTRIRYFLPAEVQSAFIYIFNMQGALIKSLPADAVGSLTIEASELTPGMYIYSLIADGKEVDSKRMIVTE